MSQSLNLCVIFGSACIHMQERQGIQTEKRTFPQRPGAGTADWQRSGRSR